MRGRVRAPIELGARLNPVLPHRENVYVTAAILWIPKRQTNKKLDDIIGMPVVEFLGRQVRAKIRPDGVNLAAGSKDAIDVTT